MKSKSFKFWWISLINLLCYRSWSGIMFKKSLLNPGHKVFFNMFFQNFIILTLTFKFMIYFKLNFVCCGLRISTSPTQDHLLLKRLFFPTLNCQDRSLKMNWPKYKDLVLNSDSQFGCIDIYILDYDIYVLTLKWL